MESKRDTSNLDETDRAELAVIQAELEADPDNEFLWDLLLSKQAA